MAVASSTVLGGVKVGANLSIDAEGVLSGAGTGIGTQLQSDWTQLDNTKLDFIKNKPSLFSGSYTDLLDKPALFSGSYLDLLNRPVLFSGSYTDLSDKPALFSGSYLDLTSRPSLFSGSYNDLTDKPAAYSLPIASSTVLGGVKVGTNLTINADGVLSGAASTIQLQSDWTQLDNTKLDFIKNKPSLFSGSYLDLSNRPVLFSGSYTDLLDKPALFSGSYNDLTDKPAAYSLPVASSTILGGVKVGANLNIDVEGVLSGTGTDLNTANTIVKRDASGNFSAGTITAGNLVSGGSTTLSSLVVPGIIRNNSSGLLSSSPLSTSDINDALGYIPPRVDYGLFADNTTQTALLNTATPMLLNTTELGGHGISIESGSRITVANAGVYNLQFSAQIKKSNAGTDFVTIWFRKNGIDIPNSATDFNLTGTGALEVASWNLLSSLLAGEYLEIIWSTPDINITIQKTDARTAPVRPSVPSVIVTMQRVN